MNIIDIDAPPGPAADGAAPGSPGGRQAVEAPPGTPPRPSSPDEGPSGRVHDWTDHGDRERMIAEAAYFRAERRGFGLGEAEIDWLEAERELTARMETDRLPEGGDGSGA